MTDASRSRSADALAKAKDAGLGPETGTLDPLPPRIDAFLPDRTTKRPAPEPAQPTGAMDEAAAWTAAEAAREAFKDVLRSGDGLALGAVIYEHPFFGPLNAYQWAVFLAGHESRHAQQIKEVAAQLATA